MKLPTAKMIGTGSRVAVYSDPITRKKLIGMATVTRVHSIKTVYIDAVPMLEVHVNAVVDATDAAPGPGDSTFSESFTVYLKP